MTTEVIMQRELFGEKISQVKIFCNLFVLTLFYRCSRMGTNIFYGESEWKAILLF